MKIKRLISLILVLALTLGCVMILGSCKKNNNEDKNDDVTPPDNTPVAQDKTFTVTILGDGDAPVNGVELVISGKGLKKATTDANGKATVSFPEGTEVKVNVNKVPDGYYKPAAVSDNYHGVFETGKYELTIKISTTPASSGDNGGNGGTPTPTPNPNPDPNPPSGNEVTYTIKVVDQFGNAVVGIGVQICCNGSCRPPVATNANGVVTANIPENTEVDVELITLSGYTLPDYVSGTYHAIIPAGQTSVTITVTKN